MGAPVAGELCQPTVGASFGWNCPGRSAPAEEKAFEGRIEIMQKRAPESEADRPVEQYVYNGAAVAQPLLDTGGVSRRSSAGAEDAPAAVATGHRPWWV